MWELTHVIQWVFFCLDQQQIKVHIVFVSLALLSDHNLLLQVLMPVGMFALYASCWNYSVIIQTVKASLWLKWTSICHGDREAMTFLYRKDQYTGCQGPAGPGYSPVNTVVCWSQDGKATASNALPTVVAWDVMSYRTSGRWRMRLYVATYVMNWRYKSGCALVPESLFVSPADRSA